MTEQDLTNILQQVAEGEMSIEEAFDEIASEGRIDFEEDED